MWFSGAEAELVIFAEQTGIPVSGNSKARGMVPDDHPLAGRSFMNLAALAQMGVGRPDVVLILGARLGLFTGGRSEMYYSNNARREIEVDIEGQEIGRNRDVELGIMADAAETLRAFNAAARRRRWPTRVASTCVRCGASAASCSPMP